ncbi:MAG: ferrous iron transport protein B [Betaproteobacteria bacterium]|nr:ferrous iron transport protein B [Betaproteobacteria bacterium]
MGFRYQWHKRLKRVFSRSGDSWLLRSQEAPSREDPSADNILLVGHPNVGKSSLFARLTGRFVTISNYPGTTVEVARAKARFSPERTIVDTPGVVFLPPQSGEERVTARALLETADATILQVGDAKNLIRSLSLAVQLAELQRPYALALNMADEARANSLDLDVAKLSAELGAPVLATVATRGEGVAEVEAALANAPVPSLSVAYPEAVEQAVAQCLAHFSAAPDASTPANTPIAPRALALAWLSGDREAGAWIAAHLPEEALEKLLAHRDAAQMTLTEPLPSVIARVRRERAQQLAAHCLPAAEAAADSPRLAARIGMLAVHPLWGWPFLFAVLGAIYGFVGVFGAGTLVGWLEEHLFGAYLNPWVRSLVAGWSPWQWLTDFIVGDYGLWTMGMTYALALILPIVSTFFIAFGVLEDSGYLSRLVVLVNRLFARMGLNGRAVLPMVLGLGCVTMATLTTRILEQRRDRIIVTFLLALAIPCSAQLGVVLGMLASQSLAAAAVWALIMSGVLLVVGMLAARVLPGERAPLMIELAPIRLPQPGNVLVKTLARLEWYTKEVIPLFLFGSALLFVLDRTGALSWLIEAGKPLVTDWLGLPAEASAAFLMGFLRRDFGATGLFALANTGALSTLQVVVGMVSITLFVPCIASVLMIAREHGGRIATAMCLSIFPSAFLIGGLLHFGLKAVGFGE